jgi:glycosyltransferase involved in cell wall biosynthesis
MDRLATALRESTPDISVLHGFGAYSYGTIAARLAGSAAVVRVEHSPELHNPLYEAVSAITASGADSTIGVSRSVLDYLHLRGTKPSHPQIIYNGVDVSLLAGVPPAPGHRILLSIARLDVAKDHASLIDAIALLRERGLELKLHLAGDGPLRGELEARVRRNKLDEHVRFLGFRKDLPELFAACDALVLSTHYEGFGLAVVEAMAAGRPVIATRIPCLAEIVTPGETGLLVEPRSPVSLADGIESVIQQPLRARAMGAAGRVRARERFDLAPSARAFDAHLLETAERVGISSGRRFADAQARSVSRG